MKDGTNDSYRLMLNTVGLGIRVDRATATIPATTNEPIFTISNGVILMTGILGECTTDVGGAVNLLLQHFPTVATAGDTDLCAVVAGAAVDVGDMLSITGAPGDAMLAANSAAPQCMKYKGVVLQEGTIDFDTSTTTTGAFKWSIWYVPLEKGALVTAA